MKIKSGVLLSMYLFFVAHAENIVDLYRTYKEIEFDTTINALSLNSNAQYLAVGHGQKATVMSVNGDNRTLIKGTQQDKLILALKYMKKETLLVAVLMRDNSIQIRKYWTKGRMLSPVSIVTLPECKEIEIRGVFSNDGATFALLNGMKLMSTDPFDFTDSYAGDSITIFDVQKGNRIKNILLPSRCSLIASFKNGLFLTKKYNASSLYIVHSARSTVEEHNFFPSISTAQKMYFDNNGDYKIFVNKDALMIYKGESLVLDKNQLFQKIEMVSVEEAHLLVDNSAKNITCDKHTKVIAYTTRFNAVIKIVKRS